MSDDVLRRIPDHCKSTVMIDGEEVEVLNREGVSRLVNLAGTPEAYRFLRWVESLS